MNTIIKRQVGWVSAIALGLLMQAAFADKLYVSGSSNDIDVIDTDSNSMITTISYRNNPNHTGSAWLYENNDLSLTKPMLSMPVANPEGTRLYAIRALRDATVSFPSYDYNSELVVLDTKTDSILSTLSLSCQPLFDQTVTNVINPSGTRLYVVCKDRASVAVIDTTINKEIALLPDSYYFESRVFDSSGTLYGKYYARNSYLDNKVAVFNANTGGLTTSIPLDDGTFATPYVGSMVTTGTRLYAMFQKTGVGNTIQVINTKSNQVIGSIPVSTDAYHIRDMRVNFEGTRLYGCAMKDILVFNLISNRLETTIPLVDGSCSAIAINASGTRLYVVKDQSISYNRVIHVIDTESNKIVSTISLNPTGGGGKIAVVSSATITPIPRSTARIFELSSQAVPPIFGGFGISGTGRLTLLFQGIIPTTTTSTCIDSGMTLRKYPSGEVVTKLKNGILAPNYMWSYDTGYMWFSPDDYNDLLHRSTLVDLRGDFLSNSMFNIFMWSLPAGYYTVSLDALGCNQQGKLSINIIEEDSSSSAKLINFSANAMLPITSNITVKGTGSIQTMFRGFKVAPCVDANLELRNSPSGTLFASNDNWETDVNITEAKALPQYLQPIDSTDAGLLRQLTAQSLTATLSSKNACQGDGVFGMDVTHDAVDTPLL